VSFHISENTDINIISCVLERVKKLLEMMKNNNTNSEYILDIGGGYSLNAPDEYYDLLKAQLNEIRKNYNVRIIAEPGTAIAKTSGKYITKVLRIKEREFFTEVFIDGGLPHGVVHPPSGVEIIKGNCEKTKRRIYRFIDNTSLRRVITTTHLRRNIQKGDIIGFLDYGAYSTVYQNDFHMWERAEIEYVD
jgi:diaminopimelate decarboxylase